MAAENDSSDRSIQMQFQSTEENGEISTFKLEDSLERAEMDISRFFSEATDGHPASPQKHLVYQPSRPNFEFLEGRSRSTLIYSRLQRPSTRDRKRKKRGRCENLSAFGWVFLSLALLQILMVTGLQIVIGVLHNGTQERYTDCVAESMNISADNASEPEFGDDKLIYICFFEFLVIYNFFLCIYALLLQNIVEIMAFVVVNVLMLVYSSIQVYQFRGFAPGYCPLITTVGWIALANTGVIFVFTVLFLIMAIQLFIEFGWKQYRFVNCNPALRYYYRYYQIFLSIQKLLIIFMVTFLIGQCILIFSPWQRPPLDPEFVLSIFFAIGMILLHFAGAVVVRRESHVGMLVLAIIGVLLFFYNLFKVVRYETRTCPRCKQLQEELDTDNPVNARREEFEHLVLFASLNIVFSFAYLIIVCRVWFHFGKGLADHFYFNGFFFDRIGKAEPSEAARQDARSIGGTATMKGKRTVSKGWSGDQADGTTGTVKIRPNRGSSLDTSFGHDLESPTSPTTMSPTMTMSPTVTSPPRDSTFSSSMPTEDSLAQQRRATFAAANPVSF